TVGAARTLPDPVEAALYRVVQESLTNVMRHSERKEATVRVTYHDDRVVVTVSNPAPGGPAAGEGLGIAGMRKRVTALGGHFSVGPTPDGRFEVRAAIPTEVTA
ncbi:MAG: sensor histidine kinase, partial [Nitriliruptorales bacterium]|nr:sensor histidine kinase [Nitriliruptorales bacterium]